MSSNGSGPDNEEEEYQAVEKISTQENERSTNMYKVIRSQRRKLKDVERGRIIS